MKRILIQFDPDKHPSSFDRVVAIDAGADEVFSYGGVEPEDVAGLVHGAIFTRGPADLKNSAIFVGGNDVEAAEVIAAKIKQTFFGPMRVSVMIDPNGSNTTAAAAIAAARVHLDLSEITAVVFGGTGPVGERIAHLLLKYGAGVRITSRTIERSTEVCDRLRERFPDGRLTACETGTADGRKSITRGINAIFAAGAAGVQFLKQPQWQGIEGLKLVVDLNAVPPAGLEGIEVTDKGETRDGITCYGAIGVGGLKMKIHKAAVNRLFDANDLILTTDSIDELATEVVGR
ncbi:NADP-dependent methylenetetrahydromethanopterin/methylenetetrahydrofolate dehydrogenase [Stratiformator vulcanicus]|uniref:Bifunctional protein MdtA n=1 Tax=Stratiformator vulcanicus TaxID=2527980 RepID=A0A517R2J9_9PLAN|nr:NADP-dependent methylenetetrahydromethanopterin/methylenetetrahydrofolate dehydrogenase [Stratiformator vulcanicus]QDT38116.1 Bifunctional protein MdtA [Stratiformator vulcanicus]